MRTKRIKQFIYFSLLLMSLVISFILWLFFFSDFTSVTIPSFCSTVTAICAIIWFYIAIVNVKKDYSNSIITPFEQMQQVLMNKPEFAHLGPILHTKFRNFEIISDNLDHLECYGEDWNGKICYISNEGFNEIIGRSKDIKEITIRLNKYIVKPEEVYNSRNNKNYWPDFSILIKYHGRLSGTIITITSSESEEIAQKYLTHAVTDTLGTNTSLKKLLNHKLQIFESPPKLKDPYVILTRGYFTLFGIVTIIGLVCTSIAFILSIIGGFYIGLPAMSFVLIILILITYERLLEKKIVMNEQAIQYWFKDTLMFHLNWKEVEKIENGSLYIPFAGGAYTYIRIYDEFNMYEIKSYDVPWYKMKKLFQQMNSYVSHISKIQICDDEGWL